MARVAVVGGGIAGLTAAWRLTQRPEVEVVVFEPGRLGGKLQTSGFGGVAVDEGPDAFLRRVPEAVDLCAEIGLDDLVSPAAGHSLLWTRGRLRPLPDGLVLGVPGRLAPIIRSGLLSPAGIVRAGLDLVLPRALFDGDVSVGALVSGRFGNEVATRLVEPLLGGIHAARLDELSAALVAPQILSAARSSRSLLLGLRRAAPPRPPAGSAPAPIFSRPAGGMAQLVERLGERLRAKGVSLRDQRVAALSVTGDAADATTPAATNGAVTVQPEGGPAEAFDAAVLAVQACDAAGLLGDAAPAGLRRIRFTDVAVLAVSLPKGQWSLPDGFNGFLVPAGEGRLVTAGSFFTNKWPDGTTPESPQVLRISAGRSDDRRISELGDAALIDRLIGELSEAAGHPIEPLDVRLSRWPAGLPLYEVGHGTLVDEIEAELDERAPRVALAGASYRGAGIPACVKSGTAAADRLGARLTN